MNQNPTKKTIKKVLDELQKDKPDLSYIRGLLEVLIDEEDVQLSPIPTCMHGRPMGVYCPHCLGINDLSSSGTKIINIPVITNSSTSSNNLPETDEGILLDIKAKTKIEEIKALSEASVT